jgi:ribosomal protein L37AE/L43A
MCLNNLSIYLLFEKAIIAIQGYNIVKIKCPKCKQNAELTPDFSFVTCTECDFDMTYGEYVKFVAHNEANYSDILGDYTGSTEGETAGTLDDWED